ncbi:MAG: lytic murein transglycosylase, partial [Solirubrobacterales bacterium]|nr:lytic murein transglycosylase [Solirubrobacterales bacterium]
RRPDGAPTDHNPTVTIGDIGAAPVGVPNFIIDQFSIPPFLLPIYQACGTQYGVPWEVLASINRIETAFGTNLNVSTAGALGWMQFMPSSWEMYGVDANNDGKKDPYNPVDAICAAARYLKAAGAEDNLYDAIFAYNHADWYVDEVLLYAKQYGKIPSALVDSLTGLTEGAHFPVAAKARYADDISEREAAKRASQGGGSGNVADVISDSPTRRGINIYADEDSPVVAVNDGVIKKVGQNKRLGKFIVLEDAYGNQFTYAELGEISDVVPVPKERKLSSDDFDLVTPGKGDKPPKVAASDSTRDSLPESDPSGGKGGKGGKGAAADPTPDKSATGDGDDEGPTDTEDSRDRVFANPDRPNTKDRADLTGQLDDIMGKGVPGYETFKSYFSGVLRFDDSKMDTEPLREGSQVVAGTILGRIGPESDNSASHLNFAITPAGRGAHTIDPKPILDGWKLLEATAIYRAAGKNPFDNEATVGQVLLASKTQLQRQVLNDPNIEIYSCGREDIASGQIDRRILATMEYLVARGYRLTITSLKCGHSIMTASGNVSEHSTGDAMDIAQVNGIPILGNQGKGSITEAVINDLLKLQGPMQPHQIISLMEMGGPTFAMADHADHIHVGFSPDGGDTGGKPLTEGLLSADQWDKLLDRIGELDQPKVPTKPSDAALPADKNDRASNAHVGE